MLVKDALLFSEVFLKSVAISRGDMRGAEFDRLSRMSLGEIVIFFKDCLRINTSFFLGLCGRAYAGYGE